MNRKKLMLKMMAGPNDVNIYGDIFGGWIMSQVDVSGALLASEYAKGRVATIAVNSFIFKHPVFIGDLLSFYAEIIKTGRTSITIRVEVFMQRGQNTTEVLRVTEAELTYVATNDDRKPRLLPEHTL